MSIIKFIISMKKLSIIVVSLIVYFLPGSGQNSSLGLVLNGGFGFESFTLFQDDYGNDVDISTGSGFSIGGEYGYDFSTYFNVTVNSMFQISKMSQQANNADGKFMRMATTLTPFFSLPLRRNGYLRVLAGAGPGLYTFGTLKIDASEAGGEEMTLKYKPAFGLQATIMFQMRIEENGYLAIGGKYYNVSYEFTEKGSTHYTTIDKINNPDGSGMAVILGFYQKF
jgi:hypothetical protein